MVHRNFRYSEEEENAIDQELGYTQKQLDRVSSFKQYQYTIGLSEIAGLIKGSLQRKCPQCGSKLVWKKEFVYVGLRHPVGATAGAYEKTYEVHHMRLCTNCNSELQPETEGNRDKRKEK